MNPIQRWIPRYISSCLGVREQEADRIWKEISEWKARQGTGYQVLCAYKPSILLPIAHILVGNWPGRDCIVGFSVIARQFGVPSLDPINQLMSGLDPEYEDIVRKSTHPEAEAIPTQRFYARWMAVEAAYDVLSQCSPSSSWEKTLIHSTVNKANYLLNNEREWRAYGMTGDIFADQVKSELRAIVRDFGETR